MSVALQSPCPIRGLTLADLPDILAIERLAYDYPWSEDIFRDCLRVGYRSFGGVAPDGGLMGYGLLSVAVGEAHVLNLCVGPLYRRKRVASQILERMLEQAQKEGAATVLLEVRPSNRAAVRLYEHMGFDRQGVRRRYYPAPEGREDALLLARALS